MREEIEKIQSLFDIKVKVSSVTSKLVLYPVENYSSPLGRPSTLVQVMVDGHLGTGEYIGWTLESHNQFSINLQKIVGTTDKVCRLADCFNGYERSAIECALLDGILKSRKISFFDFVGIPPTSLQYVVSLDSSGDIITRVQRLLEQNPDFEFKLDINPTWSQTVFEQLYAFDCVRIFDFKGLDAAHSLKIIESIFPEVILEDVPSVYKTSLRTSCDAELISSNHIDDQYDLYNIKIGRMSGIRSALTTIDNLIKINKGFYFGGQYEMSVGRSQSQKLASVFSPDAPNDLAPITLREAEYREFSPLAVKNTVGF